MMEGGGGLLNLMEWVGSSGAAPPMLGWAVERDMRVLVQSSPVDCFRRAKYCIWREGGREGGGRGGEEEEGRPIGKGRGGGRGE